MPDVIAVADYSLPCLSPKGCPSFFLLLVTSRELPPSPELSFLSQVVVDYLPDFGTIITIGTSVDLPEIFALLLVFPRPSLLFPSSAQSPPKSFCSLGSIP